MNAPGGILIVTWDGGGNVPPALALGARLSRAGHRVRVLGPSTIARAAARSGLRWVPYRTVPPWPEGLRHEDDWDRLMGILNGRPVIDDVLAAVEAERPGVLVVDCLMGAALAAAERAAVPTVALVHVLYRPFAEDWGHRVTDVVGPRGALGLEAVDGSSLRETLGRVDRVLALTPPGLDAPTYELPANVAYVGPILDPDAPAPRPAAAAQREPNVLISFSTTLQGQEAALPAILEAMGRLPVRGLLSLGAVLPVEAVQAPPNVDVIDYVPHAAVLPNMSVVVCHGGLSTVTAALAFGVPLVCIPQGREQPLNAERVEACGVGVSVSPDAGPPAIADAVRSVLNGPSYRAAAQRMATRIGAAGAGELAARLVEELLQPERVPV